MKVGIDELKQVMELLEIADEFKPVVKAVLEKSVEFISELDVPYEKFRSYTIKSRVKSIKQLMDSELDLTIDQAIVITNDERLGFKYLGERFNNNAKKS